MNKEEQLFDQAHSAGMQAAEKRTPTPMVVNDPSTGERYHVPSGVCGFASVIIKPARGKFVKFLKNQFGEESYNHSGPGTKNHYCHKHYYGGLALSCFLFGQSLEKKEAYCRAFALVLNGSGLSASCHSQMD